LQISWVPKNAHALSAVCTPPYAYASTVHPYCYIAINGQTSTSAFNKVVQQQD